MKNNKKIMLLTLLTLLIAIILTSCGSNKRKETATNNSKSTNDIVNSTKDDIDNENVNETSTKESEPVEILVSAAASMQNSLEEIKEIYELANPNVTITFNFGSSGALQQQIEQGAPADIFMSAAEKQMTALKDGGYMIEDTITDLLENKVVLIVPKDSNLPITSFETILKANTIAFGDPASVPAGQYAEQIFTKFGILDKVKEKVSYGKDVTEVLTWVSSGNAEAGIVYKTDATSNDQVKIIAEAKEEDCQKVIYPVGVVKTTEFDKAARAFVSYLSTDEAMQIFKKYGFIDHK